MSSHLAGAPREEPTCHPDKCELGEQPHGHCVCGLPMAVGADRCLQCDHEDLAPVRVRSSAPSDADRWDGRSYPSRRRRRVANPDPDVYQRFLAVVLGPTFGNETALQGGRGMPAARQTGLDRAQQPSRVGRD
jgi:hypothetical protein